mgnify:CR=1 FL=1
MKKLKVLFVAIICAVCLCFALAGCSDGSYVKESFICEISEVDSSKDESLLFTELFIFFFGKNKLICKEKRCNYAQYHTACYAETDCTIHLRMKLKPALR